MSATMFSYPHIGRDGREKCPQHRRYLVGDDLHCPICFARPPAWRALEVRCSNCGWTKGKHSYVADSDDTACPGTRMEPKPDYDNLAGTFFEAVPL